MIETGAGGDVNRADTEAGGRWDGQAGPGPDPPFLAAALEALLGVAPSGPGPEAAYRLLFEASPAPMWIYDVETRRFLEANRAAVDQYGYSRDEFLAMTSDEIRPSRDVEVPVAAGNLPWQNGVHRHRCKDGSVIHAEIATSALNFGGRPAELVMARDVTDELRLIQSLWESDETLREAQELAHLGRFEWDITGNQVRWSEKLFKIFGLEPDTFEATYEAYLARVHPEDRHLAQTVVEDTLRTGDPFVSDYRIILPDGEVRWLHSRGRLVRDEDGVPLRMLGICQDITERKRVEASLRASEERTRRIIETAGDAFVAIDAVGVITGWNRQAERTFGWEAPEVIGRRLDEVLIPAEHRQAHRRGLHRFLATGEATVLGRRLELSALHRDGHEVPVELMVWALQDQGNWVFNAFLRDISERKEAEARLETLALHDPLTGLPNRTLFLDRLGLALRRLEREGGVVAVLFVDLDRFKAVNDTLGHGAGDQLLVAVAGRLGQVLRPGDTIARFGGDEFAVVCEGLAGAWGAQEIAVRVLNALGAPVVVEGQEVITSASIGIVLSEPEATPDTMVRDADTAMYQAKEAGRNRFHIFDPASRARTLARLRRADELRLALERSELRVFYQLEIDLAEEAATGVEALVRWQHPSLGLLPPSEFIDVAEDTGLVVVLGEWVLREACRELARRDGSGPDGLRLSVNLSARQLGVPELIDTVREVLGETGLDPARLCLEITESVLMDDVESSIEALLGLKALGVRLAIDDFGTGYSSLSYLRRFPVDVVKLDRSFVAGLGVDPAATAIVAAVVNLAHALGIMVVAEGVETEEQLVALRALRCDRAQGYYWNRPLPAGELPGWGRQPCMALLAPAPIDIEELLVERTSALRAATGRTVVIQRPPNLAAAFGELGAVRSVLDHLLANAVKYSEPDRPVVVSAAGDRRWVRVSVADFGIGMSAAESTRCFEQFWQGKLPEGRRRHGTGIGLYIVRSLVEAMGGHVAVRTAPGKGSTFTFALPRSARAASRGRNPAPDAGVGEESSIREFMRQIGVPIRRGS